jgi:hypothetical protein
MIAERSGLESNSIVVSGFFDQALAMPTIKISSKVDKATWNELKAHAAETHQPLRRSS